METLLADIANCTSAFGGTTGAVFAQAIAAVVAAQCAIANGGWPKDAADEVIKSTQEGFTYDVIIVGAGTAGSLLAARLSKKFPSWNLLLIEAGDDPGLDSEVPAFLFLNQNTDVDWNYKTEPNSNHCKGFNRKSCIWSKGKGLGGSSSINAMIYVRGHPLDYKHWQESGNDGWGYEDVIPYFDIIENMFNVSEYKNDLTNPWYEVLQKSWIQLGYNESFNNNEALKGIHISKLMIANGKRQNSAKISFQSASSNNNLHVMKNTIVQRVIIDETRSVRSVEIKHKSDIVMQIKANKEVILSAGSVATPKILMLSGVGPSDHLRDIGIENLITLPVGKNLQDHPIFPLLLQVDTAHSSEMLDEVVTLLLIQYILMKTGPFATIGLTDFMCFIDTKNKSNPDIQFHHTFFPEKDKVMLNSYFKGIGYTDDVVDAIEKLNKDNSLLGIYPTLLHPKSRGEILLASNDPVTMPLIKANYFKEPDDINTLINAVREVQRLTKTKMFKEFGIKLPRLDMKFCAEIAFDSDEYWKCYIEHMATTIYHPVGTTKMGPIKDTSTVVNSDLKVHGIKNLRVVDASIMPRITGGNTMAPTLMIAEKAADIIEKYYTFHEEL